MIKLGTLIDVRPIRSGPVMSDALQPLLGHFHHGRYDTGNQFRSGDRANPKDRRAETTAIDGLRLDRTDLFFCNCKAGNAAISVFALAVVFPAYFWFWPPNTKAGPCRWP